MFSTLNVEWCFFKKFTERKHPSFAVWCCLCLGANAEADREKRGIPKRIMIQGLLKKNHMVEGVESQRGSCIIQMCCLEEWVSGDSRRNSNGISQLPREYLHNKVFSYFKRSLNWPINWNTQGYGQKETSTDAWCCLNFRLSATIVHYTVL